MKCEICKKRIPINKFRVYQVTDPQTFPGVWGTPSKVYDAIDCPVCGCQHLLKVRLPDAEGGVEDDG